jgi:hypothetical protein
VAGWVVELLTRKNAAYPAKEDGWLGGWVVELLTLNASVKNQLCSTLFLYFSTGSDTKSIQFHLLTNSNVTNKITIFINM